MGESNVTWEALSSEDWFISERPKLDGVQTSITEQDSDETIIVRESCEITIQTTDTQAAVSLQIALQLAIALVLSFTLADTTRSGAIVQQMVKSLQSQQTNQQKIIIENCRRVSVITLDTDLSVSVQAMLQFLLAIVARIDV